MKYLHIITHTKLAWLEFFILQCCEDGANEIFEINSFMLGRCFVKVSFWRLEKTNQATIKFYLSKSSKNEPH